MARKVKYKVPEGTELTLDIWFDNCMIYDVDAKETLQDIYVSYKNYVTDLQLNVCISKHKFGSFLTARLERDSEKSKTWKQVIGKVYIWGVKISGPAITP